MSSRFRFCCLSVFLGAILFLSLSCSGVPVRSGEPLSQGLDEQGQVGECARFFSELDRRIESAGVRDVEQAPISGMPYLRTDRFLSSFRDRLQNEQEFESWIDRMMVVDRKARGIELVNLSSAAGEQKYTDVAESDSQAEKIESCGDTLRRRDAIDAVMRQELSERAIVSTHYQTYKRALGLYPISSQFVLMGVTSLHKEVALSFATPITRLPVAGSIIEYIPPVELGVMEPEEVASILSSSADNPLGIPEPQGEERERLFAAFAPVWQIDMVSDADLIGSPRWNDTRTIHIDVARPRVYQRISHIWLGERVLLQLNYQVWFPKRPLEGRFDILGGHLDGMIWRVTLAEDGVPILYDTIHNCGCYHMFFPSSRLRYKGKTHIVEEPLLIPARAPRPAKGERVVLRIAHSTHYLENVAAAPPASAGFVYELGEYDTLRALSLPTGGHRSLFGTDGLVAGTQRGERWILWPMGIPEPGAMRQWGHHATAFVGRRHFDDADLLERYFERVR